jgi:hypothetical protein
MSSKALLDYVRSITQDLDLPEKTKVAIREEALAHLEDEAARCIAEGMSPDHAERAAVERFGSEALIAGMVSRALAAAQKRHRRLMGLRLTAGTALLLLLAAAVGISFQNVSGSFPGVIPQYSPYVSLLYALFAFIALVCIAAFGMIVAKMSGTPALLGTLSAITVGVVFSIVTRTINVIILLPLYLDRPPKPDALVLPLIVGSLLSTLVATILIGGIALVLSRPRVRYMRALAAVAALGLLSAATWAADCLLGDASWPPVMHWLAYVAIAFIAMVYLGLSVILSRVVADEVKRKLGLGALASADTQDPVAPQKRLA